MAPTIGANSVPHNSSFCYVTKMDWTHARDRSRAGRADGARAGHRGEPRRARRRAARRRPAAADPHGGAAELDLSPTTVSAAWALLARDRDDPHRRPPRHHGRRPAAGRAARATSARSTATTPLRLDLSTGVPDPGAAARPVAGALRRTTGVRRAEQLPRRPGAARAGRACCAPTGRSRATSSRSSTARWTASSWPPGCWSASATGSPSSSPASRRCSTCSRRSGAEVVGVPVDADGHDRRRAARGRTRSRAVYLQPRAQNPTGVSLTARRAEQLAAVLAGRQRRRRRGRLGRRGRRDRRRSASAGGCPSAPCTSAASPSRTARTCGWPRCQRAAGARRADQRRCASSARAGAAGCCSGCCSTLLTDADVGRRRSARAREAYAERRARAGRRARRARHRRSAAPTGSTLGAGGGRDRGAWCGWPARASASRRARRSRVRPGQPPHVRVTAGLVARRPRRARRRARRRGPGRGPDPGLTRCAGLYRARRPGRDMGPARRRRHDGRPVRTPARASSWRRPAAPGRVARDADALERAWPRRPPAGRSSGASGCTPRSAGWPPEFALHVEVTEGPDGLHQTHPGRRPAAGQPVAALTAEHATIAAEIAALAAATEPPVTPTDVAAAARARHDAAGHGSCGTASAAPT